MLASTIREYGSTDKPSCARTHACTRAAYVHTIHITRNTFVHKVNSGISSNFMQDEKLVDLNKVMLKCIPEDGIDEDEQPVFLTGSTNASSDIGAAHSKAQLKLE